MGPPARTTDRSDPVTTPLPAADGPVANRPVVAWQAAWTAALDELELDLVHAETLLARDHSVRDAIAEEVLHGLTWTPPADLPPLPLELAQRAYAVLERQTAVAASLAVAMTVNRRQAMLTTRMSGEVAARPTFLDRAV